jgi:hypothetical protein
MVTSLQPTLGTELTDVHLFTGNLTPVQAFMARSLFMSWTVSGGLVTSESLLCRTIFSNPVNLHLGVRLRTFNMNQAFRALLQVQSHRQSRNLLGIRDHAPNMPIQNKDDLLRGPYHSPGVPGQHVDTPLYQLLGVVRKPPVHGGGRLMNGWSLIEVDLRWPLIILGPKKLYLIGTKSSRSRSHEEGTEKIRPSALADAAGYPSILILVVTISSQEKLSILYSDVLRTELPTRSASWDSVESEPTLGNSSYHEVVHICLPITRKGCRARRRVSRWLACRYGSHWIDGLWQSRRDLVRRIRQTRTLRVSQNAHQESRYDDQCHH